MDMGRACGERWSDIRAKDRMARLAGWAVAYSETGVDDKRKEMMGTRMSGKRIGGDRNENDERCKGQVEQEEQILRQAETDGHYPNPPEANMRLGR